MKAVIDQISDGKAVILVGDDEKEHIVPVSQLPKNAKEGTWLKITLEGENITHLEIDEAETKRVKERISAKLAKLRQRKKSNF